MIRGVSIYIFAEEDAPKFHIDVSLSLFFLEIRVHLEQYELFRVFKLEVIMYRLYCVYNIRHTDSMATLS